MSEQPTDEKRYENALIWIRHVAGIHYVGGAFDPEHMRDLANMATAALQGKGFPDYAEAMAEGRQKAAEWAALFASFADGAEEDDDEHVGGEGAAEQAAGPPLQGGGQAPGG